MRIINAIKSDMKFQIKQGFYAVYVILTIIYMVVINQLPESIGNIVVPVVVFSDPSIIGFFFIGGIIMLEKNQGILEYLSVTPLRMKEYLISKILSLSMLAIIAGSIITLVTFNGKVNWFVLIIGITFSASFFTLFGLYIALKCKSINEYFIKMIPGFLVIGLPCIYFLDIPYGWLLSIFPTVTGLRLIFGAFFGISAEVFLMNVTLLIVFTIIAFYLLEKLMVKEENNG
ncbi:fluoroquinolone transport system permease protein [Natranaerovirga hydrolytica]|uniref:Fluoroquinolone transport system permease protein n=1 Tax=Natranaerovirga hydrolytica TaxID=680378 RepID=A0A4R1N6M0_9FIRM|nr:ABC transporter permease [Natranaerovirga hydrolytica]TCK98679.1 fluoroquinolone transport system permease protein [Natranaerovirga hydrolytica]